MSPSELSISPEKGFAVIHVPYDDPPSIDSLLARLLASDSFRRADRLSALLRFLVARAQSDSPEAVKEYESGVEVFGRRLAYDPRTIHSSASRRVSCACGSAAHYATEGSRDSVRIDVPRGSYRVVFAPVADPASPVPSATLPHNPSGTPTVRRTPGRLVPIAGVAAIVAVLAVRSSMSDPRSRRQIARRRRSPFCLFPTSPAIRRRTTCQTGCPTRSSAP